MFANQFTQQLSHFAMEHAYACSALLLVLVLLLVNEMWEQKNRAQELTQQAAIDLMNEETAIIFDWREAAIYKNGHIIHAINIVNDDFFSPAKLQAYQDKTLIMVCSNGQKSHAKAKQLLHSGATNVRVLQGGMVAWESNHLPVVKGK